MSGSALKHQSWFIDTRRLNCGLLALLATTLFTSPGAGASVCASSAVGIDTALANNSGGTLLNSVGQTFRTTETRMTSLTVYSAGGFNYHEVSAVLVGTDAAGVPTGAPLWEGDPMTLPGGGPKTFTWVIDPPLELPGPGHYAWFVCSSFLDLMAVDGADVYPDGRIWDTCRGVCGPGCLSAVDADFAFTVTFCTDAPTSVRSRTWGELKLIYR